MRAVPLTCFRRSGDRYTRHQAVEDEIARALGVPHIVWRDQPCRIETLVHLIRLRRRDHNPHVFGMLTYQFLERVAEQEPEALLPKFVELSRENDQVLRNIGRTLIFRASTSSPTVVLQKAWEAIEENAEPFVIAQSAIPAAAATFLADVDLTRTHRVHFAVERLWASAYNHDPMESEEGLDAAIARAADRILQRVNDPDLRVRLLMIRLRFRQDPRLRAELDRLWPRVEDNSYWHAVAVLGNEATARAVALLDGRETGRDLEVVLKAMPYEGLAGLKPQPLAAAMRRLLQRSPELAKAVAGQLELMLYGNPAPAAPELERLAIEIAVGVDDDSRQLLTYYVGSVIQQEVTEEEIARRERILTAVVQHVDVGGLSTLIWKILESGRERPNPRRHLEALARRFGTERVRKTIKVYSFLPGIAELDIDEDGAGCPPPAGPAR